MGGGIVLILLDLERVMLILVVVIEKKLFVFVFELFLLPQAILFALLVRFFLCQAAAILRNASF